MAAARYAARSSWVDRGSRQLSRYLARLMPDSDIIQAIIDNVQAELPAGWAVRPVRDSERHGVALCIDNDRGFFRRRLVIPEEMIDDAPAHGGASWVIEAMRDQRVLDEIRAAGDKRIDEPLVVRRRV